ncbi:hypothetical protein [Metaclostridioides mangenotii]|uniref:hypothetical protein n=1 Tax=Metaclostridioides mangenotii TaxID=1540 RepID=UPI00046540B9|nr:hypothetical protein [Clostridioides mangenotii]
MVYLKINMLDGKSFIVESEESNIINILESIFNEKAKVTNSIMKLREGINDLSNNFISDNV